VDSLAGVSDGSGDSQSGSAADTIRAAETELAQQHSLAAQLDLQVITAILNAHSTNADGLGRLKVLQDEIERAVAGRTDLDTSAGARDFQRYLVSKMRDIRTAIETAELDATSKATLSAAVASMYAAGSPTAEPPGLGRDETVTKGEPAFGGLEDLLFGGDPFLLTEPLATPTPTPIPAPAPAPVSASAPAAALSPAPAATTNPPGTPALQLPTFGMPNVGGGMPSLGSSLPAFGALPELDRDLLADREPPASNTLDDDAAFEQNPEPPAPEPDSARDGEDVDPPVVPGGEAGPADDTVVTLPDGSVTTAPNPHLAKVITSAVDGTPIEDAFKQEGIAIPPVGAIVSDPVGSDRLLAGDIGVFIDRYALALGNGKALLDNIVRPVSEFTGAEFLGWQRPPETDEPGATRPELTADASG
jgi:hypothetical protein